MRFQNAAAVEEIVFDMRVSEEPRAADRTILLRTFNGAPPFDEETAEENSIQVNVNDLEGTQMIAKARQQWNNAFLKPSNFFTVRPDYGPGHKRAEWAQSATRHANRLLKRERAMIGQIRSCGANTMLFGIGPTMWKDRRSVIPRPIPVGSLLVPSETEIDDFDNLMYFAVFREWTIAQLYEMTHGPKVDPGWNMDLVKSQMNYLADQLRKSPNSLAYQYMPERIEELVKQDKGYFGSDAVPTCDVWDFYFREQDEPGGWYRRIILDWGTGEDLTSYKGGGSRPESRNKVGEKSTFLYSSGKRRYADTVDQILHCQFGDCSAYAPFKYHSIRSLGWMLWGVCDLQNRLHCKFNEAVFEQMMWFFQTAGNQDLMRLKKANFEHMGVIPQGIRFLTPAERFKPDYALVQMAFARNRQLMTESSTSYTQDYDATRGAQSSRTATETMAIVNSSQALSSSILEMAYTYEAFKYREMFRRMCLKNNKDALAREFRMGVLKDGVPEDMLDASKWTIEPEQVVGGGNKTIQMATVGFLNQIRKNLPPAGQRIVDHMSVEAATDQPDLAEEIAPMSEVKPISSSAHDAQLATDRILRGLDFAAPKEAILEDYVTVWIHDLGKLVQQVMARGGVAKPEELQGMTNLGNYVSNYLAVMGQNEDDREKVREFGDAFGQIMDHVKGLAQRLQQSMAKQAKQGVAPNGGDGGQGAAKVQSMMMQAQAKAANTRESHAQRTQQRQISWEKEEARKDAQLQSDIRRKGIETRHQLLGERLRSLSE